MFAAKKPQEIILRTHKAVSVSAACFYFDSKPHDFTN